MPESRPGGINLLLLAVTVAAVLFAVWSYLDRPDAPTNGALRVAVDDDQPFEASTPREDSPATRDIVRPTQGREARPTGGTRQPARIAPAETVHAAPKDRGGAKIAGQVLAQDGTPASGVTITARRTNLGITPPNYDARNPERYHQAVQELLDATRREARMAVSDIEGRFVISGLDETLAYDLYAVSDGRGRGSALRIAAGDSPMIILSTEGMIRGRVQTEDGTPVTQFRARAWRQGRRWESQARGFESPDGTFALEARSGPMQLEVTADGLCQPEPLDVHVSAEMAEVLVTLRQAAILLGTVIDESGTPLPGAQVAIGMQREEGGRNWYGGEGAAASATTDSQGRYRIDSMAPRSVPVTATFGQSTSTQMIELKAGENRLDFKLNAGCRVSLRLTGSGGEKVEADDVWFQQPASGWTRPVRLPAREPGLVEFAGVQPGEYTLIITAAGWPALRKPETIREGTNELSYQLPAGALLRGTVTAAGGAAVNNIGVRLRQEGEDANVGWAAGRVGMVRGDGTYSVGPVEPGRWKLEVIKTNDWGTVHTQDIVLAAGANTQDVVIDAGGVAVITVTNEQGQPVPGAEVQLRGERTYSGRAGADGRATISFIAPGSYNLTGNARNVASRSLNVQVNNGQNAFSLGMGKPNSCRLTHIHPNSQAAQVGLQVGDLIVEYNTEAVSSWATLTQAIRRTRNTEEVIMVIERGGQTIVMVLKGGNVGIEGTDALR